MLARRLLPRFFGRKAKCIVSVILSVLVLLCMEIVLTAQGGTDAEVEARFLESHPDIYSYAYLKIGQKPPLSVSQMVREVLPEEEDALLVNGIGIQARSLEQLNSFGFRRRAVRPLKRTSSMSTRAIGARGESLMKSSGALRAA